MKHILYIFLYCTLIINFEGCRLPSGSYRNSTDSMYDTIIDYYHEEDDSVLSSLLEKYGGGKVDCINKEQLEENCNTEDIPENLELPAITHQKGRILLERQGYYSYYNVRKKVPDWVAWHLTANHTDGYYKRKGINFSEDEEVPKPRATNRDYRRSGYDRGHLCPSADNKWSKIAQRQSFLLTNVCPQEHRLNSGDWAQLEEMCRDWAVRYGELYIVAGPIFYDNNYYVIGYNEVAVPDAFFKVILSCQPYKAIAFIYENQARHKPMIKCVTTVDDVEKMTGIDFFHQLPDKIEKRVEAKSDLQCW